MKKRLLILPGLFVTMFSFAQQQITDFSQEMGDQSSSPMGFVGFNNLMLFEADGNGLGREIWTMAENQSEASLLKDINPGNKSSVNTSFSKSAIEFNNKLYFVANDGKSDGEIWCTDGSSAGTEKITHFLNYNITRLTVVGDQFYFVKTINDSLQVWISDGTEIGTKLVKRGIQAAGGPFFQGKCNNTFIFGFIPQYATETSLWRSDGTSDGTFELLAGFDGDGAGMGGTDVSTQYIEFNNQLFFVIRSSAIFGISSSVGIMKTDGTKANTVPVKAIHDGNSRLINYDDVIAINGKLYFSFFEVNYKRLFIWESDGTGSGTKLIYDESGAAYFMTSNLFRDDNNLVFCGKSDAGGTSLIRMNLADYSLEFIKELQAASTVPFIFLNPESTCRIQQINGEKVFIAVPLLFSQSSGWISDLTEASTITVPGLDNVSNVFLFKDSFYFSKGTTDYGSELWISDGTEVGTLLFDNINESGYGLLYNNLLTFNDKLIFDVDNGILGQELCINNMDTESTVLDIRKGPAGSYPGYFTRFGDFIYFMADDSIHGNELWRTNGTIEGTHIFLDMAEGMSSSHISFLQEFKDTLFFISYRDGQNRLCKLRNADVIEIKGVSASISSVVIAGNYLYFLSGYPGNYTLWASDGTVGGTIALKIFETCDHLTRVNEKLFFAASEIDQVNTELWLSDGTQPGTRMVRDIGVGYPSGPNQLIDFNDKIFFTAYTNESGREIWQSDGTEENTFQVADINAGSQSALFNANFYVWDNNLFFSAEDGTNGFELWKTDGSMEGTALVRDINPGVESSFPSQMAGGENSIFFQGYDAEHGSELWKSDGTEAGTVLVADILSGMLSSTPAQILTNSNEIFLIAETDDDGRQIWKIDQTTVHTALDRDPEMLFAVYPNPCKDIIFIKTDGKISTINIYNTQGQDISLKVAAGNSIDISELTPGIYIMEFTINDQRVVRKFVKK